MFIINSAMFINWLQIEEHILLHTKKANHNLKTIPSHVEYSCWKREMPKLTWSIFQIYPKYDKLSFSRWTVEMGGTTCWRLLTYHSPPATAHSASNRPTCGELKTYLLPYHIPMYLYTEPTNRPTCSELHIYSQRDPHFRRISNKNMANP